jgi:hypothetical protein
MFQTCFVSSYFGRCLCQHNTKQVKRHGFPLILVFSLAAPSLGPREACRTIPQGTSAYHAMASGVGVLPRHGWWHGSLGSVEQNRAALCDVVSCFVVQKYFALALVCMMGSSYGAITLQHPQSLALLFCSICYQTRLGLTTARNRLQLITN